MKVEQLPRALVESVGCNQIAATRQGLKLETIS